MTVTDSDVPTTRNALPEFCPECGYTLDSAMECGWLANQWDKPRRRLLEQQNRELTKAKVAAIHQALADTQGMRRPRLPVIHSAQDCAACGHAFIPRRTDARFCSGACRQFAYRQRKAGA